MPPPHLLSHHNVSLLDLIILFNSRTTNMTERSNQTYYSRIAEGPSLRIRRTKVNDERGDYGPGDDGGKGVTRAWSGDGGREVGVVDEGYHTYVRPCKSPVLSPFPLPWWLRHRTCARALCNGKRLE